MNMAAVMTELGQALNGIGGLRVFDYPAPGVVPPAGFVGWPDQINYDSTMLRGGWSATFPLLIVVGKTDMRSARDAIAAYMDSSGPSSVRAALDTGVRSAYDAALVTGARIDPVSIAGTEYLAALFDVAVTGRN